ncbi:MAG: methyltransferase domain-containing protein, partial [Rhodospirillaceae bacterium]|nr:methyltransferase domain-containing protein [Rhodospirillaceae bacterium]
KLAGVLDQAQFAVMDGENLALDRRFDLITGSLSFQWFDNPMETLERLAGLLKGQGVLAFATIGVDSLHEWRSAVSSLGAEYESIIPTFPSAADLASAFPDSSLVVREKSKSVRYDSARDFLDGLKCIGALTTQSGEAILSSGQLRALLRRLDEVDAGNDGFSVTHNILFGQYRRGEIS